MNQDYKTRLEALGTIGGVDAVVIVPGSNLEYFTGLHYHLSERPILAILTGEGLSFIVPKLEVPSLVKRPDLEAQIFAWSDEDGYAGAFAQAVDALGLRGKTLGVDGLTMRVTEWLALQQVDATLKVKAVERDIIRIRAIKQADEVDAMRRATAISEKALAQLLTEVVPGMTERQIAARLEALMTEGGADGPAFGTLVQTGENSDNPRDDDRPRPESRRVFADRLWLQG